MPVVSITTRSNLSAPRSRLALSSPRMRIRSPRTVQHMQPLFISTICSSACSMIALSIPTSPNSFSITAMRWPWSSLRMRLSSVVLPLPRKPVRIVTGTMSASCMSTPCEGAILPRLKTSDRPRFAVTAARLSPDLGFHFEVAPDSGLQDQQALQVFALGKLERDRVVGGRGEALDDPGLRAGIERGAGDDRLKEFGAHATRAREARQQPAGGEQLQREQVDVLVGARGVARLRRRGRELGRIEHHHVEARAAIPQGPELGKNIGLHKRDARRVERIRRQVLLRHLER